MFNKILIANRGEIACRIIKTARKLGIETVAIYSTPDADSEHVRLADRACWVGEAPAKASYLNIEAIIAAAKASQAQAIHPGYGFLSENPLFAKACEQAGIVFIGPSISAMEAMASKQLAKQMLESTNVPLTPGYHGSDQDDQRLLQEAEHIGFPVLLKAANGGGGKGMRAVNSRAEFGQALAGARREAMASFADDTMIIEKLVVNPRHVEVQIMADNHGNVVHIFERDCSIQRRHQKIIEEAPAPDLNPQLRQQLAAAACEVARSINYRGAGTVEFLVDHQQQHFYFMEMNTRLQVEHPVTEMITGLDLVAWQIQIAANQPLPLLQEQITEHGHAIECRIYAEDPHRDFIPSTGKLHFLKQPQGEGIRIDSGITCHSTISQYYDPMIAKLIVWGETRQQALQRLQYALAHYAIGGVKSNIPFLQTICQNERFRQAQLSTDFLNQENITLPAPDEETALLFAAAYDFLATVKNTSDPVYQQAFNWQLTSAGSWTQRYLLNGELLAIRITPIDTNRFELITGADTRALAANYDRGHLIIDIDGQKRAAWVEALPDQLNVYLTSGTTSFGRYDWQTNAHGGADHDLTAPMPATVVAILKKPGDAVKKGEQLIVLEAMKMEHAIHAPKDGILAEVFYDIGSQVSEGAKLLALDNSNT
ncbi:acetyl/propionyl/methylcrotonyl-CoA carboxylase subunit alpha [Legionella dresdenensis]|uniref:Acetyl/propionyl/methylcrotonyl-CoA carboxylase subunit alpha n=1 Tax=Legionella dresdenensis TaxID=450200 RepID=A0ABV8CG83_9GAMM